MFLLLKWVLLGPVVRWLTRMRVTGDLPRSGSIVIAANHLAEIDSLVLCLALRRRPTFVAKSEYFEAGLRGRLYGTLCRLTGQIPIPRTGGAETALAAASNVLQRGDVWAIYPEGTRSPDGRLPWSHRGHARRAAPFGRDRRSGGNHRNPGGRPTQPPPVATRLGHGCHRRTARLLPVDRAM